MLRCRQCETVTKTVSLDIYRSLGTLATLMIYHMKMEDQDQEV